MKKTTKVLTIAFCIFSLSGVVFAYNYLEKKTLSSDDVKKKWGSEVYDAKKFKAGDYATKSKMAYSIMQDKALIGKKISEIRDLFGPSEGYFFTDTIPVYIIQRGKTHSDQTWQLVFLPDKNDRVLDIIMHKNCCDE